MDREQGERNLALTEIIQDWIKRKQYRMVEIRQVNLYIKDWIKLTMQYKFDQRHSHTILLRWLAWQPQQPALLSPFQSLAHSRHTHQQLRHLCHRCLLSTNCHYFSSLKNGVGSNLFNNPLAGIRPEAGSVHCGNSQHQAYKYQAQAALGRIANPKRVSNPRTITRPPASNVSPTITINFTICGETAVEIRTGLARNDKRSQTYREERRNSV